MTKHISNNGTISNDLTVGSQTSLFIDNLPAEDPVWNLLMQAGGTSVAGTDPAAAVSVGSASSSVDIGWNPLATAADTYFAPHSFVATATEGPAMTTLGLASALDASGFTDAQPVTIVGYTGKAMEPEISPDGQYLFFNNANDPGVDTNLYYATRIDDATFQLAGTIEGTNTEFVDAIPSMDVYNHLYFITNRSYFDTLSTVYRGDFHAGIATDVGIVGGNIPFGVLGVFNMDASVSRDGQNLYFTDNVGTDFSDPNTISVLRVAEASPDGFTRLTNSDAILQTINDGNKIYGASASFDQRELFFTKFDLAVGAPQIYEATRASVSDPFGTPIHIDAAEGFVEAPSLSLDGTSLYFSKFLSPTDVEIFVAHRPDTMAPAVTIGLANDDGSSSTDLITSDPTLRGSGDPGTTVMFTEGTTIVGQTKSDIAGKWVYTPALYKGDHTITATETDLAGNVGAASLTFTYEPALTIEGPAPSTSALSKLEGLGLWLTAGSNIATFTSIGGKATDTYAFSLSGSGAGHFAVSTGGNGVTLATGSKVVTGVAGGALYALSVGATDVTNGAAAPPMAVDIIVGRVLGDTINAATLTQGLGISLTTPTFIYGLGYNDTLSASGMSGPAWLTGGGGSDMMTGGTGANTYMYGSTFESSPLAFDIISNFNPITDHIDLTGIGGSALTFQSSALTGNKIAGNTIGWQQSNGNTFLYVNTSSGSRSIGLSAMKIEMNGKLMLADSNVLHN